MRKAKLLENKPVTNNQSCITGNSCGQNKCYNHCGISSRHLEGYIHYVIAMQKHLSGSSSLSGESCNVSIQAQCHHSAINGHVEWF